VRSDREWLLEAIERIEAQAARGRTPFVGEELVQTSVIRWIESIGKAVRGLSDELPKLGAQIGAILNETP
jgi:uncharacterized protein with HEPN domain